MASRSNLDAFTEYIREIHQIPKGVDWRAKWQQVTECLWAVLSEGTHVESQLLDIYLRFVADPEYFVLARLVNPSFRSSEAPKVDHPQKQRIMDAIEHHRKTYATLDNTQQQETDDVEYTAEKKALLDSEMHRARILLHDGGYFGSQTQERIQEWLDQRPDVHS